MIRTEIPRIRRVILAAVIATAGITILRSVPRSRAAWPLGRKQRHGSCHFGFSGRDRSRVGGEDPSLNPSRS
jgi:hypothetical protein